MAKVYIGFSTVNKINPPFSLTDIALVKQDLLNNFSTRRGERPMRPTYGSVIHDLLLDPLDDITEAAIIEDVRQIIASEPRVQLNSEIRVTAIDNAFRVEVELMFLPYFTPDQLVVVFEQENQRIY